MLSKIIYWKLYGTRSVEKVFEKWQILHKHHTGF